MLATGCLCCAILLARLGWPQQPRILEIDAGPGYNLLEIYPPMHGSKDVESDEVLAKVAAAQSPVRVFRASVESRTGLSSTIAISCGRTQTPAFIDPDDLSLCPGPRWRQLSFDLASRFALAPTAKFKPRFAAGDWCLFMDECACNND